jgi:hypothetical protein
MWLLEQSIVLLLRYTYDKVILVHAASHIAADQESDATEHLLLDEGKPLQLRSYAFG